MFQPVRTVRVRRQPQTAFQRLKPPRSWEEQPPS